MALPATNVHERVGHKQVDAHMRQAAWRRHAPHSECAGLIAGLLLYFRHIPYKNRIHFLCQPVYITFFKTGI